MSIEELMEKAKAGDFEAAYQLALAYRDGKEIEKSDDLCRKWFEEASKSKNSWVLNDYADYLIATSPNTSEKHIYQLLSKGLSQNHPQSIRIYGRFANTTGRPELAKVLFRYSVDLGNKWAVNDLMKLLFFDADASSSEEIVNIGKRFYKSHPEICEASFEAAAGLLSNFTDFKAAKTFLSALKTDPSAYARCIDLMMAKPRDDYAAILDLKFMQSVPELAYKLAIMYRDGVIVEVDPVRFVRLAASLPENLQEKL